MLQTNPFSILAEIISPLAMQGFIIAMIILIAAGTVIQMIHHKNLTYFFNNARKAKLAATKTSPHLRLQPALEVQGGRPHVPGSCTNGS